ncbi:MAG: S49 family peptidase [Brachymonas sp.]|jgi:protease-4
MDDISNNASSNRILSPSPAGWERATIEKLLLAQINESKATRRWRIIKSLLWMLLLAGVIAMFWDNNAEKANAALHAAPHTALINIQGEIGSDTPASADLLLPALREAFEASGAQAVMLRINSPGGSPVQAGQINDEIRRLKAKHHKKVYVVVDEMCASAAYYIAASADEIYVDKASLVGSIGVLMDGFGFTGTMEKLGVERRLLTAGTDKGMLDPFSPQNPEQVAHAQAMLDEIHQQFIAVVKEGRGKRLPADANVFTGKFWTGQNAIKLGLADKVGSLDQVARDVVKAEDIVDYTPSENMAERLAKKLGAGMGESMSGALGLQARLR